MSPILSPLRRWHACTAVAVAVLLTYAQAPRAGEFHYDDGHSLVRNEKLWAPGGVLRFFTHADAFGENPDDRMYRPLVWSLHRANHALGGLEPGLFVAVNLTIHALTAVGVTWWLAGLVPLSGALAGGLLFGLHPLQSEVVHYVSARSESLAGLFVILAVATFAHSRTAGNRRWQLLSLIAAGAGLLCKATALVTPALIAWTLLARRRGRPAVSTLRPVFPYIIISVLYLLLRQFVMGHSAGWMPVRSGLEQSATQAKALIYYITSIVMPVKLSVLPQFEVSRSVTEPAVIASLTVALSLGLLAWLGRRQSSLPGGMAWFIACLGPTLAIPLNVLVNDHRPYLALAGICWALVGMRLLPGPRPGLIGLALLALLSWQRADAWKTEVTLWQDAVVKGPSMAYSKYNLGWAHHLGGSLDSALVHYRASLALEPDYPRPMTNLGALLRQRGDLEGARAWLERADRLEPDRAETLNNLGLVVWAQGDAEGAIPILLRASRLSPSVGEIWLNLGLAQRDAGRRSEALGSLQRALQLDPGLRQRIPLPGH